MNQGFNMQDVMRMAMMQRGQGGQGGQGGQHRMPDGSMMANSAMGGQMGQGSAMGGQMGKGSAMTQDEYMRLMKQKQMQQMAMQMMQAGQPGWQHHAADVPKHRR